MIMPKLQVRTTKKEGEPYESYLFTIPKEIIDMMQWKKGDTLIVSPLDEKSIKVEKAITKKV